MTLVGDSVLAVSESVPELDRSVAGTGNDLAVVGGERDGENVVGVADEAAGGDTSGELTEAEGLVPRSRESVGTVGGDNLFRANSSVYHFSLMSSNKIPWHRKFSANFPRVLARGRKDIRSRKRCGSGRGEIAWGSRIAIRPGSGSR